MITLIAACAPSPDGRLVIGKGGGIPWSLPEDLARFKKRTFGHTLVMGRKTYESLKTRPLLGRRTIILTKNRSWIPSVSLAACGDVSEFLSVSHDPRDVVSRFLFSWDKVFICGGSEIYQEFLPWCQEIDLTVINHVFSGDVFFPETLDSLSERFQSQFTDAHEKNVDPKYWNGTEILKWRHIIYGRKIILGG